MKLFDTEHYEDYGHEWFLQVLTSPKFALLDMTVQWDEYECDDLLPAFQLSIGSSHLFGGFIRYKRFQFDWSIIDWKPRNLEWYRRSSDD